jgi:hypothetical protein
MNAPNFGSILDKQASTIEPPKNLPVGSYVCMVNGRHETGESSQKKTPFVRFELKPTEAMEDVDQDALEEAGGIGDKTIRADFYLTEASAYRLKEFLEHCGIDSEGRTMREMLDDAPGCTVVATIRHEMAQDGSNRVFARLGRTSPYGE